MRKVRMMRNSTSAMPNERIQLSNQRANVDRRFSGGAKGTGAGCASEFGLRAPNSCMAFTLAAGAPKSTSPGPPPGRPPPPAPVPERVRMVAVAPPGRETRGAALALDPHPHDRRVRERAERAAVERRATG